MKNKPLSQPQQIQRGEITPEALEAEGWENKRKTMAGFEVYAKGDMRVVFKNNDFCNAYLLGVEGVCKGVKTMSDLRTLDRLVNGVAIPS